MYNTNESRWGPISKRAFLAVLTAVLLPCLLSASVTTDDIMKATGARAVGMGGAFSAVSDDYSAFYWNPAGLVLPNKGGANVFYDSIFSGNERNFGLNYTYPAFSDMAVAATYLKTLYMSSKFTDDLFYLTYATYLHEERSVSFGINLKFINISAPAYGLSGFTPGFDAGFMIYPQFLDGKMRFALVAQDLDSVINWSNNIMERVPVFYKAGASYSFDKTAVADIDLGGLDYANLTKVPRIAINIGGEKWFMNRIIGNFAFRAGWQWQEGMSPNSKFSFGMSYSRDEYTVNYVYMPGNNGLGDTHKVDFSYAIGARPQEGGQKEQTAPAAGETAAGTFEMMAEKFKAMQFDVSNKYLSPNNDKVMDTVDFLLKGGPARAAGVKWKVEILNPDNSKVNEIKGMEIVQQKITWDGADQSGYTLKDGDYTITYTFEMDGKQVWTKSKVVTIDTAPPRFKLSVTPRVFAPKKGGTSKLQVHIDLVDRDVNSWKLFIRSKQGSVVRKMSGDGPADKVMWAGDDALGNIIKDGDYEVVVDTADFAGNVYEQVEPVTVDTHVSRFSVETDNRLFKSGSESVVFVSNLKDADKIKQWDLEIKDSKGNLVKSFRNKGAAVKSVTWNGTNDKNKYLKEGEVYRYRLIVNQKNGITAEKEGIIQSIPPEFQGVGIDLTLAAIDFAQGSKDIGTEEYGYLNQAAEAVKKYAKNYYLLIKGYATDLDDPDADLKLSIDRALAIKDYLITQGVSEGNIYTTGYGDGEYAGVGKKEEIAKNGKRVEVELITK